MLRVLPGGARRARHYTTYYATYYTAIVMGKGSLTWVFWKFQNYVRITNFVIFGILRKFAEIYPKIAKLRNKLIAQKLRKQISFLVISRHVSQIHCNFVQFSENLDSAFSGNFKVFAEKAMKYTVRLPLPITILQHILY